jgi:hypothetical protein
MLHLLPPGERTEASQRIAHLPGWRAQQKVNIQDRVQPLDKVVATLNDTEL